MRPVGKVLSLDCDSATIHPHHLMGHTVKAKTHRRAFVRTGCAQWMGNGHLGSAGVLVVCHVEEALAKGPGPVPTLCRSMEATTVKAVMYKWTSATLTRVLYMGIGVHGAVGEPAVEHAMEAKCDAIVPVTIPGQQAVEGPVLELTHRFTAVTPIFAQWMETGVLGKHGMIVQQHVEVENRRDSVCVTIQCH